MYTETQLYEFGELIMMAEAERFGEWRYIFTDCNKKSSLFSVTKRYDLDPSGVYLKAECRNIFPFYMDSIIGCYINTTP